MGEAWLEVVRGGPAMVQDAGRPGFRHHGVPPGGALVPELLAAANLGAGNVWGEAALEVYGPLSLVPRGASLHVSTGEAAWLAPEGQRFDVPSPHRASVHYVAVRGGLRVPRVLGGRGTLRMAALGGFEGRLLKRGDLLLCVADAPAVAGGEVPAVDFTRPLRVLPGPDLSRFTAEALDTLLAGAFEVSRESDRTGLRLVGPAPGRTGDDRPGPGPMVGGAIQVPASGELLVMGPDGPTTGGYPVLVTVIHADLGSLWGRRPGAEVRFLRVTPAEAREAWAREQGFREMRSAF